MSYEPAKEWKCDSCPAVTMQTGPRAADVLPTPPEGWALVDVTIFLPPRTVPGEGGTKVKMGPARHTIRRAFCSPCSLPYLPTIPAAVEKV